MSDTRWSPSRKKFHFSRCGDETRRGTAEIHSGGALGFLIGDTGMKTAKPKNRFPAAVWREIEQRACAGVTLQTLSDAYGIGIATLNDRSKRFEWQTPARLARRKAALSEGKNSIAKSEIRGPSPASESLPDLLLMADAPPAEFQAALAKWLQHAIARGIANVSGPRTVAELKALSELHRKAAGLDASDGSRGNEPLVNPRRSVSRRPVGVVVEVVEVEAGAGIPGPAHATAV
jgi:hypothetical protein